MEPQTQNNQNNSDDGQIKIMPTRSGPIAPIPPTSPTQPISPVEKKEEKEIIKPFQSSTDVNIPHVEYSESKITFNPNSGVNVSPTLNPEDKIAFRPENKVTISPIHTYADDVKNTIKDDGVSVVQIAMAEAKKQETEAAEDKELSPSSSKNKIIISVSLFVIILGVVGAVVAWYVYSNKKMQDPIQSALVHRQSIIPYDQDFLITLDTDERSKVIQGIETAKKQSYDKNTTVVYTPFVQNLGTTTNLINTEDFLSLLQTRTPAPLARSFGGEFMFGLSRIDDQTNTFMILTTDSFSQMYAGMLEWEPAMADDIGDLFYVKDDLLETPVVASTSVAVIPGEVAKVNTSTSSPLVKVATTSVSTSSNKIVSTSTIVSTSSKTTASTSSSTSSSPLPEQKPFKSKYIIANSLEFKDELINNRDMRVLRTTSGKVLMYYTFINDKILLIAKDFKTLDEVVKRLATSQFKQ